MDFTFSDDHRLAAQSLRELLADHCTGAALRATSDSLQRHGRVDAASDERVAQIVSLGLTGLMVPESLGGLGLAAIDFVLLAEEAGRAGLPEPVVEMAGVALPLLADMAMAQPAALPALQWALENSAIVLYVPDVNGSYAWLATARYVLLGKEAMQVSLCSGDALQLAPRQSFDTLRPLSSVSCEPANFLATWSGEAARHACERASARGAVFVAAQQLGLAQRLVDLSVAYAGERRQFGKPIGANQSIQHLLASVQIRIEFARPVVYAAAAALSRAAELDEAARVRISHAKLAADDAADLAARTAIQVHGAMGYSWELDVQFYAKRAWALAGVHGDRNCHAKRVQERLLSGALPLGPDRLFAT